LLPEGDVTAPAGSGVSKPAASRHFVALSSARLREWLTAKLSGLDLLVVQIDGIHISENLILVAAIGIEGEGIKHPLALMEGATENAAVAQALIDNLIERGLDPAVPRLFIMTARRRCRGRSGAVLAARRRSSVARFTRRATSWSDCRRACMLRSTARCARPGSWTMQRRPSD
jgi:hypothetical protein